MNSKRPSRKAPSVMNHTGQAEKLKAFSRLERSRNGSSEEIDVAKERETAINEKYGSID